MIARLTVVDGTLTEYPIAEKVRGGWQNGVTSYRDEKVTDVRPLHVTPDDVHESGAPTEHTRIEMQVWSLDCLYDECGHGDPETERPRPECPASTMVACQQCSDWNAEYEGAAEPWPCENYAVQAWQGAGGKERQQEILVEAFLSGWNEHRTSRSEDA